MTTTAMPSQLGFKIAQALGDRGAGQGHQLASYDLAVRRWSG